MKLFDGTDVVNLCLKDESICSWRKLKKKLNKSSYTFIPSELTVTVHSERYY